MSKIIPPAMALATWLTAGAVPTSAAASPLPGQIMVDPSNPAHLVYNRDANGDGKLDPYVMVAPGDPEGFLYLPHAEQDAILQQMIQHGGNGLYLMVVRSHGGDGRSHEHPFRNGRRPGDELNEALLARWEQLFTRMDAAGITIYLFLYDDHASPFGKGGRLPEAERRFLKKLVARFQHHPMLIWCVAEEYRDALGGDRARAIAAELRRLDAHGHPIAIHHTNGDRTMDFPDDPNVDVFAMQSSARSPQALHADVRTGVLDARGRFQVTMAENMNRNGGDHRTTILTRNRTELRQRNWAALMAGGHVMVLGTWAPAGKGAPPTPEMLADMRRAQTFLESLPFNDLRTADELAAEPTTFFLAFDGKRYLAYSLRTPSTLSMRELPAGGWNVTWFDPADGARVTTRVDHTGGPFSLPRPSTLTGQDLVLSLACAHCDPALPDAGLPAQDAGTDANADADADAQEGGDAGDPPILRAQWREDEVSGCAMGRSPGGSAPWIAGPALVLLLRRRRR